MRLFDAEGRRLSSIEEERRAFVLAAAKASRDVRASCGVLRATGCRIPEALALAPRKIDLPGRVAEGLDEVLRSAQTGVATTR
jgi:hypothetical protein